MIFLLGLAQLSSAVIVGLDQARLDSAGIGWALLDSFGLGPTGLGPYRLVYNRLG